MTLLRLAAAFIATSLSTASAVTAQGDATPTAVSAALERIKADNAWTIEQQISICEIPAPPFKEERRAAEMKKRFEALGLRNVRIDSIEVDFLWRDRRLVVETDGYRYHRGKAGFERDRERDLQLRGLGYEVIRVSEGQLADKPRQVGELLGRVLAEAG